MCGKQESKKNLQKHPQRHRFYKNKVIKRIYLTARKEENKINFKFLAGNFHPDPFPTVKSFSFQFVAISFAIINQHEMALKSKEGRSKKERKKRK